MREELKSSRFLTDLFIYPLNVERCYSLLTIREGSAYYFPKVGVDYQQFIESSLSFQNETVASFIQQEAIKDGVPISDVEFLEKDYQTYMTVTVLDVNSGSYNEINIGV